MDVIEIDAASNRGVDEIRDRDKVKFAPAEGSYKIYIIDEVHMLTTEAFNALLKTLEEPPAFVVFILATTEVHKIPATILSRCQRFDFKRFTIQEIAGRLQQVAAAEGVEPSPGALRLIAEHSEGGMRDAIGLLEQALAHSQGAVEESDVRALLGLIDREEIAAIADAIREKNIKWSLDSLAEMSQAGKDIFQFGRSMVGHFRELLLETVSGAAEEPSGFTTGELIRIIETLANATAEVKRSFQSTLPLELALIKLTTAQADSGSLEARLNKLEADLEQLRQNGVVAVSSNPAQPRSNPTVAVQPATPAPAVPVPNREKTVVTAASSPNTGENGEFGQWEDFLEAVKQKKRTLAALIQEGKPVRFDGALLEVGFPPNLKFHLENLAMPHNKELLENILQELCGTGVRLECIPFSNNPAPVPAASPKSDAGQDDDVLKKAMDLFGGNVRPLSKEE
jgi:DNA polymerase-3 subunit gamma/tau